MRGFLVYIILTVLSEIAVADQFPGSFRTYTEKTFAPISNFVVGWVYLTGIILAMSSEATAASLLLQNYFPNTSLLLSYVIIMTTHHQHRKTHGCPPQGDCQLIGYPYISLVALVSLLVIIFSMPLVPGQGASLLAGLLLVLFYTTTYLVMHSYSRIKSRQRLNLKILFSLNSKRKTDKNITRFKLTKQLRNQQRIISPWRR